MAVLEEVVYGTGSVATRAVVSQDEQSIFTFLTHLVPQVIGT